MINKYPQACKLFHNISTSYSTEELHEFLVVGVEFSNLWLVKIEPDHLVPGVDSLFTRLASDAQIIGTFLHPRSNI